jgi:FlaA1/EpsC-like NDP-sugar epimerase
LKNIFITGASGSMGSETLKQVMDAKENFETTILLRNKKENQKLAKKLKNFIMIELQ